MAQFKTRTLNVTRTWNYKLRLRVNDVVVHNGIIWQNVTGINSEPGINEIDWIRLAYKLFVPFIPLSGTEVDNPVTGNVQILGAGADLRIFSKGDSNIIENEINFGDGSISVGIRNTVTSDVYSIQMSELGASVKAPNTSSGLDGDIDYSSNYMDNSYTQKKYVDLNKLTQYTVSTLPIGVLGQTAFVTDATAPTYLGPLIGGGAVVCPVFFNGTIWVSH